MADTKITDLTAKTTRSLADVIPHVDLDGTPITKKITVLNLLREVASELTIATGAVTFTQLHHKLQPQTGTTDDLDTINGTTAGQFGVVYVTDYGTDTITIKHNTGNILCVGNADISLSNGCVFWFSDGTKIFISGSGGGAGVSDGDKGDITISGSGATYTIDNGVVSLAKMADMATASLLGRNTGGTGAPEVLSAATVRTLLGLGTGDSPQFTGIEVGHATDTTLSRNAAGVLQVEGVVLPSISSTNTLTNKRVTKRVGTTTSSATPTINTDNFDIYTLTAQTANITSFTTNLSGTPTNGQTLLISVTGTAARTITWGASFENGPATLPTTTTTTQRLDTMLMWNAATSKWRCMATGSA